MSLKDIAVFMFSPKEDEAALAAGEALARANDADLAAVLLEMQPDAVYTMEGVMITQMWAEVLEEARKGFAKDKADLAARIRKSDRPIALRELTGYMGLAATEAAVHARHADLSIMVRPGGSKPFEYRNTLFEGILFGSGRPIMIVPPSWKGEQIGKRVVVAWNGKRESARALADAIPLLEGAEAVYVVTIDAKPAIDGVGPAPGEDITAHLARHGLKVELRNLDGRGQDETQTLIGEARAVDADLIVMGGYGRARLSEMVFGGVTRAMAEQSPIPVLMSH